MGTPALSDSCRNVDVYPELRKCLTAEGRSRWSEPTIAAASAIAGAESFAADDWELVLDRFEAVLAPLATESMARLRARPLTK